MTVKAKICGLSTPEAIEAAQNNGASFLGFIFAEKSPRFITPTKAAELAAYAKIPKVAVVVDASDNFLDEIVSALKPDYIQLHGSETDERAKEIKARYNIKLIRALELGQNVESGIYDFLMFDSPGGGTGKQFDYTSFSTPKHPWFLSGGLDAGNLADAVAATGAELVDVSSGVESARGVKDLNKIVQFLNAAKKL